MMSDSKHIRVLMVIPFLRHVGGMEKQSLRLAGKLRERGIDVSFLTTARPWEFFGSNAATIRDSIDGFPVTTIPGIYIPIMKNFPLEFLVWGVFFILFHRQHITILHGHQLFSSGVVVGAASRLTGIPSLVKLARSNINGDIDDILHRPFKKIKMRLFRHVTRFIAIIPEMMRELEDIGIPNEKILHIPNGVNSTIFSPPLPNEKKLLRQKLNLPLEHPIVLWDSRLSPSKRPEYVLEAWSEVHTQLPEALLIHIGRTGGGKEYQANLQKTIQAHHLETSIRFMGVVQNPQDYAKAADCFTYGAPSEGLSNALLQAAATGLSIAVPENEGNKQIVQHGVNGFLAAANDPRDLALQLITILTDREKQKRFGTLAREHVQKYFSLDSVANSYAALYMELLDARS